MNEDLALFTFIGTFILIWPLTKLGIINKSVLRFFAAILLFCSVYNFYAGLYQLTGWNPFSDISTNDLSQVAGRGMGRGGIFLLMVKFYPYISIGMGIIFSFVSLLILFNPKGFIKDFAKKK